MFVPKTERIERLAKIFPKRIKELETIFRGKTFVYIDFANVFHWQEYLGWHIDMKRVKQLLNSFDEVEDVWIYAGTLKGDPDSEFMINEFKSYPHLVTKPVKIIPLSIDMRGISLGDPIRLENFIQKSLLRKLEVESIEFLNKKLIDLNKKDIYTIEQRKCNFDVEMGSQIMLDIKGNRAENFVLWTGDSDFAAPIEKILNAKKTVTIFATSRRITDELDSPGVLIFDIRKIKEFICFPRDLPDDVRKKLSL